MAPKLPNPKASTAPAGDAEDPFLYDTDALHAIASESVVRQGLRYFNENRVMDLHWEGPSLCALVEGSRTDMPYRVELGNDREVLQVGCECDFAEAPVCKHAVAVLYAYAAQASGPADALAGARDQAIQERSQRGRGEVRVRHVSGKPWSGTWQASSIASATHHPQSYTVHLRSLQGRGNYCTCPDLATNQLGTCKHIEAVLHQLGKRRDYARLKDQPPPFAFVYLAWDVAEAPRLRLQRAPRMERELARLCDEHFDAAGLFKGRLPEAFFRFSDQVYGRSDIHLGEDAQLHVRRIAAEAAHRLRASEIRAEITRFGGHLPGIRARLYPYQVEGVAFLAATGRALLADDMGLGKTLQAISAAAWLARHEGVQRVLVVCPASLKHQWAREIERFTEHQAEVVQGGAALRHAQYRKPKTFVVINYELVLRDLSVINEQLCPDLLILDEAQRIKNWRTKIASSIKLIATRYAFVLSGTPLENRLEDLYSLMQVVDAQVLGPLWRYLIDFHVTDERGKVLGYRNLSELRRRIAPVMLRRDRSLVREQLPERIEQRLDVPLTAKQQDLHDSALSTAGKLAQTARRRPLTPSEQHRLMAALQQARMACNAAGLVDKETQGSPKLDELKGLLEDLCLQGGLKAVIFSQWERMTAMVEELVRGLGIGCVRLHGGVPSSRRGELMERFREDEATRVFISTDAGGTGLNLQSASVLINLDIPWNPAVLEQRIARIHRLGQTRTVQVILLVAENAYEERVLGLNQGKRELFANVVSPEAKEDVVGISRKLLESLAEDLLGPEAEPRPAAVEERTVAAAAPAGGEERPAPAPTGTAEDASLAACIAEIQAAFGARIERIVGSQGGLIVVMEPIDAEAERISEGLSGTVPVALLDPRSFNALRRLGAASPLGETRSLYVSEQAAAPSPGAALLARAREKLRAAETLIDQDCPGAAAELLGSAMLSAVAARGGLAQPPAAQEAAVWIYGEAVPKGLLSLEQAAAVVRAGALGGAPQVPGALLEQVLEDARGLVDAASA